MEHSTIIQIGKYLVSSEIVTEYFCCDYDNCHGICCIIGDSGAPLLEKEASKLERHYSKYSSFMRPEGRTRIEETGYFEIDGDGDMVTPLLGDKEECAYALFENGNCLCAIERAHIKGKCPFVKPISCRLYPIRASKLSNGFTALNLHRWNLCECAFHKGKREGILVYQFLREPVIAAFGQKFYDSLDAAAKEMRKSLD